MRKRSGKKYNPYEHLTLTELLEEYLGHMEDDSTRNELVRNRVWNELHRRDKETENKH